MFCWIFRILISHSFDAGKSVTGITKKHMDKCEECRHFYNISDMLENTLPVEAKLISENYSARPNERIIQNINETKMEHSLPHTSRFRPIAVAAGLILVFSISVFFLPSKQKVTNSNDEFNKTISEFAGMMEFGKRVDFANIIEEPIQNEVKNIVSDTKTVANFFLTCFEIKVDGTKQNKEFSEIDINSQE